MSDRGFQLMTVVVGDEPDGWARAGFTMDGAATRIGTTTIVCDPSNGPGIREVAIDGLAEPIDGLRIGAGPVETDPVEHPNQVVGFDHLVAMSPAIERTAEALQAAGLTKRRTREFAVGEETRRQDFFWLGDVILELVGVTGVTGVLYGGGGNAPDPSEEPIVPASFWGLALECADLDAAADALGDGLGRIKDAVQSGRRIATLRAEPFGLSVPIALMSPHVAP